MGHAACLLWSSREGEKARWCWAEMFSLHSPLIKGGFLEEEEKGVKKAEKGQKEPEEKDRWTRISEQGKPETSLAGRIKDSTLRNRRDSEMRLLGRGANIKAEGRFPFRDWKGVGGRGGGGQLGGLELMKDAVVREAVSLSHVCRTSARSCPS